MKFFIFIMLLLNFMSCNKLEKDELDFQREEEYDTRDIRDHELELDNQSGRFK